MVYFQSLELSDYGSWASIISLVVSFITLLMIFSLKKKFMFRSGVEGHQVSLRKIASKLSQLFLNFDKNIDEIYDELAIADVKLRNLQKGASDDLLSDIKKARKKIFIFRVKYSFSIKYFKVSESHARKIYTAINVVVEELINVKKELLAGK